MDGLFIDRWARFCVAQNLGEQTFFAGMQIVEQDFDLWFNRENPFWKLVDEIKARSLDSFCEVPPKPAPVKFRPARRR